MRHHCHFNHFADLPPEQARLEIQAHRNVRRLMFLLTHATVYVLVNLFLVGMAALDVAPAHVHTLPLRTWGVVLVAHALIVFMKRYTAPLHERMIQRERERLQQRDPW